MSIEECYVYRAWCDRCDEEYGADFDSKADVERALSADGWILDDDEWLCPNCIDEELEDAE